VVSFDIGRQILEDAVGLPAGAGRHVA